MSGYSLAGMRLKKSNMADQHEKRRQSDLPDIDTFLSAYSGREVMFCPNPGNGGDAFIAYAAFRLFNKHSIRYRVMRYNEQVKGKTIFYGGGGNLIEGRYPQAYQLLTGNLGKGNEIVMMPSTIRGFKEFLVNAPDLVILCREAVSYAALRDSGFPSDKLHLIEDLAFSIDVHELKTPSKGSGDGFFFRRDSETTNRIPIPDDNMDISLCWNGDLWDDPEFTEAVCRSIAIHINRFETIHTDRLHVGIISALYGKKVLFYPNDYYKNRAVYEQSLHRYRNVTFMELPAVESPVTEPAKEEANLTEAAPEQSLPALPAANPETGMGIISKLKGMIRRSIP
jgi:exopolysaccharide biosynthesis predicted pyruvyltransferase EpsI